MHLQKLRIWHVVHHSRWLLIQGSIDWPVRPALLTTYSQWITINISAYQIGFHFSNNRETIIIIQWCIVKQLHYNQLETGVTLTRPERVFSEWTNSREVYYNPADHRSQRGRNLLCSFTFYAVLQNAKITQKIQSSELQRSGIGLWVTSHLGKSIVCSQQEQCQIPIIKTRSMFLVSGDQGFLMASSHNSATVWWLLGQQTFTRANNYHIVNARWLMDFARLSCEHLLSA